MLRIGLLLFVVCRLLVVQAQDTGLYVYGTVKEYLTRDSIAFPRIHIVEMKEDALPEPVVTNARGRYEMQLTEKKVYRIYYGSEGKVGKCVEIDSRDVPPEEWNAGFGMLIEITLFDSIPNVDLSILNEPIGRARYDPVVREINWDLLYTEQIKARIVQLMKEYDASQKKLSLPDP